MPKNSSAMAAATAKGKVSGTLGGGQPTSGSTPAPKGADVQQQYLDWMAQQAYVQPRETPKGKYRGYSTQTQLDNAIYGAGLHSQDAALQAASELIARGGQTANDVNRAVNGAEKQTHDAMARAAGQYTHKQGEAHDAARGMGATADRYSAMANDYLTQQAMTAAGPQVGGKQLGFDQAADLVGRQNPGLRRSPATTGLRNAQYENVLAPSEFADGVATQDDYRKAVDEYLKGVKGSADPYLQAAANDQELGATIADTPLSEYMQTIAQTQFGFDPELARGRYGPEQYDVAAYKDNRDLTSIEQTGMLPGEYATQQRQAQADAEDLAAASDEEVLNQIGQGIYEQTGYDPNQLAQSVDLDVPSLSDVISSDMYRQYDDALRQAAQAGDQSTLERTLSSVSQQDPTVYRVLEQVWKPQVGGSYLPAAPNTWQSTRDPYAEALATLTNGG